MNTGIYQIRNIINGKRYIGSAGDRGIVRRWSDHIKALNIGNHHSIHLQRAWNKYRAEAFVFEIIEECVSTVCLEQEQCYLDTLLFANCDDDRFHKLGYNISRYAHSGMRGRKHTKEAKQKISLAKKGNCGGSKHPMFGKYHTEEAKSKNRKAHEKLTAKQVRQVKLMLKNKMKQKDIANQFDIDQSTVSYIKSGRIWSHIREVTL